MLHTATSNITGFEDAALQIGIVKGSLLHHVRADLLSAAQDAGGLTPDIARETAAALRALSKDADVVLLTCSTLGPSIEEIGTTDVPILRVDAALAAKAVSRGGLVVALCALETTITPTTRLFTEAAAKTGSRIEIRLVPGSWDLFTGGDRAGYLAAIAKSADAAYADGASIVALAQASMAGAEDLVSKGPRPLSSPTTGLAAAVASANTSARRAV